MMTFDQALAFVSSDVERDGDLFINVPRGDEAFVPRPVLLWFPAYLVVMGDLHDDIGLRLTALDVEGDCMLLIPCERVKGVFTLDEVDAIEGNAGGVMH